MIVQVRESQLKWRTKMTKITLKTNGETVKVVGYGHPCFCQLDRCRVRLHDIKADGMVEVTDNDGKVLPDYRHASQLIAL
jgi:hypothetical protein